MALVLKDRVQETTTTTGTGTVTLAGAVSGFQSFSAIGNGNTCYYAIVGGTEWEVGLGTYTSSGTTLSRDTILESSNGGTAVNFSAGTKNVFVTYPAEKSIYQNASGVANLTSTDVTTALGYTPVTDARTLTINGTSYDLTANRTWSVGTVTSVTGTAPIASTGGATPAISISQATTSTDGYLSSTDWNTFNNKAPSVTYTSNYIPYGQGTTTPALSANFTYDGTSLNLVSTNATGTIVVTDTGTSGGNIKLVGNGATTPNKTIRAFNGNLAVVNNAYSSEIFTLTDAGALTVLGSVTANGTVLTGNTGTVTSVGITAGTGISVSGSPITSSGSITVTNSSPMTYPSSGIAVSTGSAWGTSYTTSGSGTVVALATSPTLTTATTSGTFTLGGSLDETVYAVVDAAGVALTPQNGTIQTWTLGASRTPTSGTWNAGESMTLMINDGTAYTVTWTTLAVTWVGGSAPTLATTGFTVIELWKVGTTIYGALVGSVA